MKLIKYGGISIAYVCLIQLLHGILLQSMGGLMGGPVVGVLAFVRFIAFLIPIVVILVRALKINNLYNVRRFALRGIKKNALAIVIFAVVLFLIGSHCYVGYNAINIFLSQINTTNLTVLACCYNIFDDGVSYVFAFLLGVLGLAASYNLPLTGNER